MSDGWLVKWRLAPGSDSVLARWETREAAQRDADALNARYQTDEYYVEAYDLAKVDWMGKHV